MVSNFDTLADAYDSLLDTPLGRPTSEAMSDTPNRSERWKTLLQSTETFQQWFREKMQMDFGTMETELRNCRAELRKCRVEIGAI